MIRSFKYKLLRFTLCLLLVSSHTFAQNEENLFALTLEDLLGIQVVSSASGYEQKVDDAPATVAIIHREQWRARGAKTLIEALQPVAGLHTQTATSTINRNLVHIRGLSGVRNAQVKYLINGMPIYEMHTGGIMASSRRLLTGVKRIEIVKGPGSVVYGADAFAGVINLVTEDAGNSRNNHFGTYTGSYGNIGLTASHGAKLGELKWFTSLEYSEANADQGRKVNSDLQSSFDNLFDTQASKASGLEGPGFYNDYHRVITSNIKLGFRGWELENYYYSNMPDTSSNSGVPGLGVATTLDTEGWIKTHLNNTKLNYALSDRFKGVPGSLKAEILHMRQKATSVLHVFPAGHTNKLGDDGNLFGPGNLYPAIFPEGYIGTPSQQGYTTHYSLTHTFHANEKHGIRWQTGYEDIKFKAFEKKNFGPGILDSVTVPRPSSGEPLVVDGTLTDVRGTDYIYLPDIQRNFWYASVQDEWSVTDDVTISAGVRHDKYSDFGATTNPRASINWKKTEQLTLKLFAGTAFRAPSFVNLFGQNNPVAVGDAELKPETVRTYEFGFNYDLSHSHDLVVSGNLYNFSTEDLIENVAGEFGIKTAQNIGQSNGDGIELILKWKPFPYVSIDTNFSHSNVKYENGLDVHDIPENLAYLGFNVRIAPNINWNIDAKYVGGIARDRSINNGGERVDIRNDISAHTLLATTVGMDLLDNTVSVAISVTNLFDKQAYQPFNNVHDDLSLHGRQIKFEIVYKPSK